MGRTALVDSMAEDAFYDAHRRAILRRVWATVRRRPADNLLSLAEVRDKLRVRGQHFVGIEPIPIDHIVGTVGRYQEFDRAFLPRQQHIRNRWKQIYEAALGAGFPPIEVYRVGEVYFVHDGHHRVSVLKELGAQTVEAAITELETPIALTADVSEEQLALKAEQALFLETTRLDQVRPESNVELTVACAYPRLLEHVCQYRYLLEQEEQRPIDEPEAAARWFDQVYSPLVKLIAQEVLLAEFPGRTPADLYLWMVDNQDHLTERFGQEIALDGLAADLARELTEGEGRRPELAPARAPRTRRRPATVAVFGSGSTPPGDPLAVEAECLGRGLAAAGLVLVCGGYGGVMEAASRGAQQAGGQVIGVTMDLFAQRLKANTWLTRERRVKDFFPRLKHLTRADAFVVLRGGIGTLTELTLTWSLLQTGQISPRPFVFVGEHWPRLFDAFRDTTTMTEDLFRLATVVDGVDEALAILEAALAPNP